MDKMMFIAVMNKFMKKREEREEWLNKLDEVFPNAWESILEKSYESLFVETLSAILNDNDNWLSYFLYDRDCKWFSYEDNGKEIEIDSFEKLYDLITS